MQIAWTSNGMTGIVLATLALTAGAQSTRVAPVEYREVDTTYSAEAVVEAVRQSTISAQVMGRVVELRVDAGDRVKTGQVIAWSWASSAHT